MPALDSCPVGRPAVQSCFLCLTASPVCFPFCPTRTLGRRNWSARRRRHDPSYAGSLRRPGPSSRSAEVAQSFQSLVWLFDSLPRLIWFLPYLLDPVR